MKHPFDIRKQSSIKDRGKNNILKITKRKQRNHLHFSQKCHREKKRHFVGMKQSNLKGDLISQTL